MSGQSKISANTLFHFTKTRENLIGILGHTFRPRYCWEDISTLEPDPTRTKPRFATPMVCFCDIPLSQVQDHAKTYGNYAIGLTKEWGIKNLLNPVFYIEPHSNISKTLRATADIFTSMTAPISTEITSLMKNHVITGIFSKPYRGRLFRHGSYLPEEVIFYNEREWRYIPSEKLEKAGLMRSVGSEMTRDNPELINNFNKILVEEGITLAFQPNDVRYIIVEKNEQVLPLAKELQSIKSGFSEDERMLITTRLISMEQIKEDF